MDRDGERLPRERRHQRHDCFPARFVLRVDIRPPYDHDVGRCIRATVQEWRNVGIGFRVRMGLHPGIEMCGEEQRTFLTLREHLRRFLGSIPAHLLVQPVDSEVDGSPPRRSSPLRGSDALQPFPGLGNRGAIHRIVVAVLRQVGRNDDARGRWHASFVTSSQSIKASKALAERIKRGCLGHERIEIEIGPDLDGLRRDYEMSRFRLRIPARPNLRKPAFEQAVPVEGTDAAREKERVLSGQKVTGR